MTTNFEIRLLGGMQIRQHGERIANFMSSKVPALLAYLVVSGRPHQRDALAGLLWGEMPDDAAANNLRQALTNLRKVAESHLTITRETVAFDPQTPYHLDVEEFRRLMRLSSGQPAGQRIGLLRQALALYQGDFLEGFYVRDAPDFEDWALVQRVQLRELALDGWAELTAALMDSGDYEGAVNTAGRLLAMDLWREEAHRQRMLALARSGKLSAALAQYQACRDTLRREFDAEPSSETTALYKRIRAAMHGPRHNLPAAMTGFVGREQEMAELRSLLASPTTRLLTIIGPGGVGKTRLAVEAAAAGQAAFLNGVWFASLAAAQPASTERLAQAVAQAVLCPLAGAEPPQQQVIAFLAAKELLLVLDNLEEWLEVAPWLCELLAHAPDVKILATSRQRLDLQAERVFMLEGLPAPRINAADPTLFAAVQLFLRRARRVDADLAPDEASVAAIAQICRLVEGLPLGIELAAAWASQLSSAEIAAQIERNLDFLATTRRDVAPRQRSLRAVFDWSWGRLQPDEQAVFIRLAVFRGPFSREAAAQVAQASPAVLATLVDRSLAWRRGQVYQLHEVARQFGWEKLSQAGAVEAIQASHAACYAGFLAQRQERLQGQQQPAALAELEQQIDNVRAAWLWLVEQRDVAGIAVATDGYYRFLAIRSRLREGFEVFEAARLAMQPLAAGDPAARRAYYKTTARAGRFLSYLARYAEARALLHESMAAWRALGDKDELAFVLNHLGGTARMEGNLALSRQLLHECLALRQETGNLAGQAVALLELGGAAFVAADFASARDLCQEGVAVAERAGDVQTIAHLLTGLSLSYRELGQFEQALAYGERSQAIYQQLGDAYGQMQALLTLGELSRQMGQLQPARRFCQQAVQIGQEIGDRSGEADGHYRLGQIAVGLAEPEEALQQLRQALRLGMEAEELPIILDTLLEIGCLLGERGDGARASKILSFLLAHPQFPERHRTRAEGVLASAPVRGIPITKATPTLDEIVSLASAP